LKGILGSEKKLWQVIKEELTEIRNQVADPRRTEIIGKAEDLKVEDLIEDEQASSPCPMRVTSSDCQRQLSKATPGWQRSSWRDGSKKKTLLKRCTRPRPMIICWSLPTWVKFTG
jgi:DNA gyrase/topoisomerase IV subunit A